MTTKQHLLIFSLVLTFSCQRQRVETSHIVNKDATFNPDLGWVHLEENQSIGPYTRLHNKIFCGEVGCEDHPMKTVDIASFEVWPGTEYARDKDHMFFPAQLICACGDSCSVCYNDNPILEGTDPVSFRCIEPEIGEDKNAKYVREKSLPIKPSGTEMNTGKEANQDSGKWL